MHSPAHRTVAAVAAVFLVGGSFSSVSQTGLWEAKRFSEPADQHTLKPGPTGSAQGAGTNLVADSGFEAGSPNPHWEEHSDLFGSPLCTVALCGGGAPSRGEWWVWFGGAEDDEVGFVAQQISIPEADSADLQFWLTIGASGGQGSFEVKLDGDVLFGVSETDADDFFGYTPVFLDVSDYADGQSHELRFESETSGGIVNFFVDDVCLRTNPDNFSCAPRTSIAPLLLQSALEPGQTETRTFTIRNVGDETLVWALYDAAGAGILRPLGVATVAPTRAAPLVVDGLANRKNTNADDMPPVRPAALRGGNALIHHSESFTWEFGAEACTDKNDTDTTTTNQFLRTFTLTDFAITSDFEVVEVEFWLGLFDAEAEITVNLYTLEGEFVYDNMTLIGSATESFTPGDADFIAVPVSGTAPAGSTLVVEIAAPDLSGQGWFSPGANSEGESAPSYLASDPCGIDDPTSYTALGLGGTHLVMTVHGNAEVECPLPAWASAQPQSGSIPGGGQRQVNVTFDSAGLDLDEYRGNVCTTSNDPRSVIVLAPQLKLILVEEGGNFIFVDRFEGQ